MQEKKLKNEKKGKKKEKARLPYRGEISMKDMKRPSERSRVHHASARLRDYCMPAAVRDCVVPDFPLPWLPRYNATHHDYFKYST